MSRRVGSTTSGGSAVTDTPATRAVKARHGHAAPSRRLHVLVVDDSPVLRQVMRRTLMMFFSSRIASVIEASDGLSALDRLETCAVDLIVLDVQMPMMNGPDVLEAIRRSPRFASLPIVVVTGTTDRETVARILDLGVAGYLVKPLSPTVLRERLAEIIASVSRQPLAADSEAAMRRRIIELRPNSRVLVVDRDAGVRRFWVDQLRHMCCVDETPMSTAALRKHHAGHYDIIVIGQAAGVLAAEAFADKLRETSPFKPANLLALVTADDAAAARESGRYDGVLLRTTDMREWLEQLASCLNPESTARLMLAPASPCVDRMFARTGELIEAALRTEVDVLQALPNETDHSGRWFATCADIQCGNSVWHIWLTGRFAFALALATAAEGLDTDHLSDTTVLNAMSVMATSIADTVRAAFEEIGAECRLHAPTSEVRECAPVIAGATQESSRWISAAAIESGAFIRLVHEPRPDPLR
jgi:two-component system chemotaxis response regulator CheY